MPDGVAGALNFVGVKGDFYLSFPNSCLGTHFLETPVSWEPTNDPHPLPHLRNRINESTGRIREGMQAPTTAELLNEPTDQQALDNAWVDSLANDPARRHEEGGWIYMDTTTGAIVVRRAPAGSQAILDLTAPAVVPGSVVVATFHTHPNPSAEGWDTGPSTADTQSAWLFGVPCLIRADDGIHTTGPDSRRGGLLGGPGYPP
jgi:hypothetical protein